MSPSRPFILRPVATSLLMAAIMLVGIVAYTQLPVSALPEVDYPTIQVLTFYPGASPDVVATTVTAPLERQFGEMQGLSQMTSTSSGATSVIVLQFNLSLNIDIAEEEVQSAINAAQSFLPADLPAPPIYSKTNPADAPVLTLGITSKTMPLSQVEDYGRHPPGAQDLAAERRRPGQHQRRPEAGRAHPGQPGAAAVLRHRPGSRAHRPGLRQRQPGQRQLRRSAPGLPDRRQRSVGHQRRLQERRRRLPQQCPRLSARRRQRRGRGGEHQAGGLDEPDAGGDSQRAAPARRQHHQRGQEHQAADAAAAGQSARRASTSPPSPTSRPTSRPRSPTSNSS